MLDAGGRKNTVTNTTRQSKIYDKNLDQNPANHQPLSPLSYLPRAALVYPDKTAVIDGKSFDFKIDVTQEE